MQHLRNTFLKNSYSRTEIRCTLHPKEKKKSMTPKQKPTGMAIIPYMQMVSGKISRLLAKYNINIIHQLVKKTNNMLKPVKDNLGWNVSGIYHILCECGKVYVGQTGHTITARCKEHDCHI
jgi:hypothetical protein